MLKVLSPRHRLALFRIHIIVISYINDNLVNVANVVVVTPWIAGKTYAPGAGAATARTCWTR